MRLFLLLALLAVPAPAFASGGFDCAATDGSGLGLSGAVGRVTGAPLVTAHLRLGERLRSTTGEPPALRIGRSWIDSERLWVDLVDPDLTRYEARLRARPRPDGTASGTLERDGQSHPVRCILE